MVTETDIERETNASCVYLVNEQVERGMSIEDAVHTIYLTHRGYVRSHVTIALLLADGRNKKRRPETSMSSSGR